MSSSRNPEILVVGQETEQYLLDLAVGCIERGGVLLAPTETVYGLLTGWSNAQGRQRIFEMKRRETTKHLQMLAADLPTAVEYGLLASLAVTKIARCFWPGPLTAVCPARDGDTVGLRIPRHPLIQALLKRLRCPLAASSANRSGQAPARTVSQAMMELDDRPDLILDGGEIGDEASTVIQLLDDGFRVLRKGPVSEAQIRDCLHS